MIYSTMSENNLPIKREISTIQEMTSFIGELKADAPLPIKYALDSQLQIISAMQSPTIIDTALSTMVLNLRTSLACCSDNKQQQKLLKEQFSLMIQNLIFFLDVKVQYFCKKNNDLSRQLFIRAGEGFSNNLKNLMLLTIETFSSTTKVVAAGVDVIGTNVANTAISLGTEAINASKTGSTTTTKGDETTHDEKGLDPEIARANAETGKCAIETINGNLGQLDERTAYHVNEWRDRMENVIINNVFSEERLEKQAELRDTFYKWWNKESINKEEEDNFYGAINNTIKKLWKYREVVGKSMVISDMIERYLPYLQRHLIKKSIPENRIARFLEENPANNLLPVKYLNKCISFLFLSRNRKEDVENTLKEIEATIDEYQKIANYFDDTIVILTSDLPEKELKFIDEFRACLKESGGKISSKDRKYLEKVRIKLDISEERAKELEEL